MLGAPEGYNTEGCYASMLGALAKSHPMGAARSKNIYWVDNAHSKHLFSKKKCIDIIHTGWVDNAVCNQIHG